MNKAINVFIRLVLTAILVAWAVLPNLDNTSHEGILGEISKIGVVPAVLLIVAFFVMVAFYCLTLQKCLTLIKPENRKADPKSVWYMFAVPFNFIEDFFIVINIANSIEEERKTNPNLKAISDFGMVSGIGWSVAQILSFIPGIMGQIAGLVGMVLVIYHWIQIARINRLLAITEDLNL